jgi:hypothetical protein
LQRVDIGIQRGEHVEDFIKLRSSGDVPGLEAIVT